MFRLNVFLSTLLVLIFAQPAFAQAIIGYADPSKPEYWAQTVGFWMNAQRICGVEYDPQKLEARTAEYAALAGLSVTQIKRLAVTQAEQAAPHFTDRSCRHARAQAKRLDLLPDRGGWGSRTSSVPVSGAPQATAQAQEAGSGGRWHDFFIGKTHLSYDSSHGTQVFFLSPNGHTYLFYPGNQRILRGDWAMQGQGDGVALCFRYGRDTFNPALGTAGGNWDCADPQRLAGTVKQRAEGDPFRLSRRTQVPFVLSAGRTTLEELYGRLTAQ